jgi:hypothetical protein
MLTAGLNGTSKPAYWTVTYIDWHIPDVTLIHLFLLMMSTELLETCRIGINIYEKIIVRQVGHLQELIPSVMFHWNPSSGSQVVPCGHMEGQTERQDAVSFCRFAKHIETIQCAHRLQFLKVYSLLFNYIENSKGDRYNIVEIILFAFVYFYFWIFAPINSKLCASWFADSHRNTFGFKCTVFVTAVQI